MPSETGSDKTENRGSHFVTLEGLKYFLEKLQYEFAHNGPSNESEENTSINEE